MKSVTKGPINGYWEEFRKDIIPEDAAEIQVDEMRKAFYAGGISMLFALRQLADTDEMTSFLVLEELEKETGDWISYLQSQSVN